MSIVTTDSAIQPGFFDAGRASLFQGSGTSLVLMCVRQHTREDKKYQYVVVRLGNRERAHDWRAPEQFALIWVRQILLESPTMLAGPAYTMKGRNPELNLLGTQSKQTGIVLLNGTDFASLEVIPRTYSRPFVAMHLNPPKERPNGSKRLPKG